MAQYRKPVPKTPQQALHETIVSYDPTYGKQPLEVPNRGYNTSTKGDSTKDFSVGLMDIDSAVINYINDYIRPTVTQDGEQVAVPTIYAYPERWVAIQKEGFLRDANSRILTPLIVLKRDNIERNRSLANKLDANQPHNIAVTNKKYSQQNGYSKFNTLNGIKPEQTLYATVVPDYITVTYDCAVFTYYNEQLNKIIEAVEYAADAYWGDPERFKFKTNIDSFASTVELSDNKERVVKSTFSLKMHGYIIPDTIQKGTTFVSKFSNRNKLIVTSETVVDINNLPTPS